MNKRLSQTLIFLLLRVLTLLVVGTLFVILGFILVRGASSLSWEFVSEIPRNGMAEGGILPAIVGTLWLTGVSMAFAFPIGVFSGIYMAEYAKPGPLTGFIEIMTNNLAGIPSIVFGLFGMSVFVITLGFGDSILAGSLTLSILVLPIIIRTTEEAIRDVPSETRWASIALGANKLQTIFKVVLPVALPRILTGLILSLGRVAGETAPILFTVAAFYLPQLPDSVFDQAMALPYHLYVISTSGADLAATRPKAYGTALVLLFIILVMTLTATLLRRYYSRKYRS